MVRKSILMLIFLALSCRAATSSAQGANLDPARNARDQADLNALRAEIENQQKAVAEKATLDGYLRLATLQDWMCEAAYGRQDTDAVRKAAEGGVEASKKAIELNPNSSEAHRLLGHHLGNLIPHVFAGGMRYGQRSTIEVEKSIKLDPNNANAYISRAIGYYFTPGMFGGDKNKALEVLEKALKIDANSDTALIWLAQVLNSLGHKEEAMRAVQQALRLNPQRRYAEYVRRIISGEPLR